MIKNRVIQYFLLFVGLFCIYFILRDFSWVGNKQLHSLMELMATLLSLIVGVLALVRYYTRKNNGILFLGAGFLGTSFLDGYHTVVTSTFFDQIMPSPSPSLIPWSWNASRIFLSILMFVSWWAWKREDTLGEKGRISENKVYVIVGLFTIVSFCFFAFFPLPRAYYPELFFGRPEEYIAAYFFFFALIGYFMKGGWKGEALEHWIVVSLIIGFMSQAMFMPFSFSLFDMMFDAAHLLKKMSYICVLVGLLITMYVTFKEAEEDKKKLVQTNIELKSLDKMKTNFLSTVSHELRTPLTSILGNNRLIFQKYNKMPDLDKKQFLKIAIRQGEHLLKLVNDILDVAKAESGHLRLEKIQVDLEEIVQSSLESVRVLADEKKINLEVDVLVEKTMIFADPNRLQQILINLLGNAIKFTSGNKKIFIKIEDYVHSQNVLLVSVIDSGVGIPEDKIDVLFNRFIQVDNTPTREVGGTGLGLSIVKELVHLHGGRIWVESEEGKGSKFFFTILKAVEDKTILKE